MSRRIPLVAGIAGFALWAIGLAMAAKAALLGWLVAALAFAWVPVGCLAVLMMVVLVPGSWRSLYTGPLLLGSALLPAAAVAILPLLLGLWIVYPWADPSVAAHFAAFKAAWLSPAFFIVRQLVYWAILIAVWLALLLRPLARVPIAAAGLIAFALVASWMGVDLAETLTPEFHSSIYGLLILGCEWLSAVAFALVIGLRRGRGPAPPSASGALMVALLMWAYLHAMQFIVVWSGDLPDEVVWYLARGTGGWAWVTGLLFVGQGLVPFFAMLLPAVRSSRRAMSAIASLTLCMRPLESAWLLLPQEQSALLACLFALAALVGIAGAGAAGVLLALDRRPQFIEPARFVPRQRRA